MLKRTRTWRQDWRNSLPEVVAPQPAKTPSWDFFPGSLTPGPTLTCDPEHFQDGGEKQPITNSSNRGSCDLLDLDSFVAFNASGVSEARANINISMLDETCEYWSYYCFLILAVISIWDSGIIIMIINYCDTSYSNAVLHSVGRCLQGWSSEILQMSIVITRCAATRWKENGNRAAPSACQFPAL